MKKKEKEAGMNDYLNTRVHTNTHTHRLRTTQALHKKRRKKCDHLMDGLIDK